MKKFKVTKGYWIYYIAASLLLYDAVIMLLISLINSYIVSSLLKVLLFGCTVYHIYYIVLYTTLKYFIDKDNVIINGAFGLKKVIIPLKNIQGYIKGTGDIKAVRLSGFGKGTFALGKFVVHNIGTTNMFVPKGKEIIYIKTEEMNYAISPEDSNSFIKYLSDNGISSSNWETKIEKEIHLYKDKKYIRLLILVSIVILVLTLMPFILYLFGKLPRMMPLNFDAAFYPVQFGTGKQFAINQMIYGVLNMAVLFCMYYASYFYAKYDKKSAKKFIYVSLVVSLAFLFIQFRILYTFK